MCSQHTFAWPRPRSKAQPGVPLMPLSRTVLSRCCWALAPCWTSTRLHEHFVSRLSQLSGSRDWGRMFCCAYGLLAPDSHCWVHPFSLLMAPRFVDNFIRRFTKDKNQHNKTLKFLVLIFVCGYSVNILMQNVSDQCLRTTRQCEIHVW